MRGKIIAAAFAGALLLGVFSMKGYAAETTLPDQEAEQILTETEGSAADAGDAVLDAVLSEEETVVPEEGTVTPEEETVVPEEEAVLPEEETVVPEEEAVLPEEEAALPEEETVEPETEIEIETQEKQLSKPTKLLKTTPDPIYPITLKEGIYEIRTSLSNTAVIGINGFNAEISGSRMAWVQRFILSYDSYGRAILTCYSDQERVLWAKDGVAKGGTDVRKCKSNDSDAQRWILKKQANGYYIICSALNENYVLNVDHGKTADGTNVLLRKANGSKAQEFFFINMQRRLTCDDILGDGVYKISSALNSDYVINIKGESKSNGAAAVIYKSDGSDSQMFRFEYDPVRKNYKVRNIYSGKALDVAKGNVVATSKVRQETKSDSIGQRWIVRKNSDGTYTFLMANSGLALAIAGSTAKNNAAMQLYHNNGSKAQKFKISEASDGVSTGIVSIIPVYNEKKRLEVANGSRAKNANVQLMSSDGSFGQKFYVQKVGKHQYTIRSIVSGYYMTDKSGDTRVTSATDDTAVWIAERVYGGGTQFTNKKTGKVLDVKGAKGANGTNVITAGAVEYSNAQRFQVKKVPLIESGRTYQIISKVGGKNYVLHVKSGSVSNGANVQICTDYNYAQQKWVIKKSGSYYKITNGKSRKNLELKGGKSANGTNVQQSVPDSGKDQNWKFVVADGGWLKIQNANGKYLDVNGSNVDIWGAKSGNCQLFRLEEVSPATTAVQDAMYKAAQSMTSYTNYKIVVDTAHTHVGIYKKDGNVWTEQKYWICSTGSSSTPTVKGHFTLGSKGYSFGDSDHTCYWYSQIYGGYLFHSILYVPGTNGTVEKDARMGKHISGGCVRLLKDRAKWIYDYVPSGTGIYIY